MGRDPSERETHDGVAARVPPEARCRRMARASYLDDARSCSAGRDGPNCTTPWPPKDGALARVFFLRRSSFNRT